MSHEHNAPNCFECRYFDETIMLQCKHYKDSRIPMMAHGDKFPRGFIVKNAEMIPCDRFEDKSIITLFDVEGV